MDIAQEKRRDNIAEYIIYLWQLEDLMRALQFSPEAIWNTLVAPRKLSEEESETILNWYVELCALLREEGKQQGGHLDHTLHLIADLNDLHLHLLELPAGAAYRSHWADLAPELPQLRAKLGPEADGMNDIELCFRTLYATMLYRIKGQRDVQAVSDTITLVSPVIGTLASIYGEVERGEMDLYKTE